MLRIGTPLIISSGALTLMQFCDRLFLARHSAVSIQAALPAGVLSFTFIGILAAAAGYAGTIVAHHHGAGQREAGVRVTVQGLWRALASLPCLLLLAPLGMWALKVIGHSPEVMAEERIYFGWMMRGGFLFPLGAVIGGYFTGQGRMRLNTIANSVGALLNIVLDYIMIFGKFGFPAMGIEGGAIATVISASVAPLVQLAYFLREPAVRALRGHGLWRHDFGGMWRILRFGLPAGLQTMADVAAFAAFVMLTGRMDAISLATSNIALSINSLVLAPLWGIGGATAIMTGQHKGMRDAEGAARSGWAALEMSWMYIAAVIFVFIAGSDYLFSLFYSDNASFTMQELQGFGFQLMLAMAVGVLFDATTVVISGALRGAGDTRFVMIYTVVMSWGLWIPGEALIFARGGNILHAWYWMALYFAILSIGFVIRWRGGRWRNIAVIETEAPSVRTY